MGENNSKWKLTKDFIVQLLSPVGLFATPMECSMPGFPALHYIPFSNSCPLSQWCHPVISSSFSPLLLLPLIFPSIRVFSNELILHIKWPKYWGFTFVISSSNEYSGLISLLSKGLSRVFSSTTIWKYQFFKAQPFLWSNSHIHTWLLENHSFDYMDFCQQSDVSAF